MKLLLLAALFVLASATSPMRQLTRDCCPCSESIPEDGVTEFQVDIPDVSRGKPKDLVVELVRLLLKRQIFDQPTAGSILLTFRVPAPTDLPSKTPLTVDAVQKLPKKGRPDAFDRFVQQLIPLVSRPTLPSLIKALTELIINNRVPISQVVRLTTSYSITLNFRIRIHDEKLRPVVPATEPVILVERPTLIRPTKPIIQIDEPVPVPRPEPHVEVDEPRPVVPRPNIHVAIDEPRPVVPRPNIHLAIDEPHVVVRPKPVVLVDEPVVIPQRPEPTFTLDRITPGEPGESTVAITVVGEKDAAPAVNSLLEILVSKKIIDIPTAYSILVTFNIPGRGRFRPNGARPLSKGTISNIKVNAADKPRERFIKELTAAIVAPSPDKLIRTLLILLIDSGTINLATAQSFLVVFRISGKLQFTSIPPVVEPDLVPGQDPGPTSLIDSTVRITDVLRELPPLAKRLVELSVKHQLFTQSVGQSILVTFGIKGANGVALTQATVASLTIGGKPGAAAKFIKNLTPLLANPASNHATLIKILTELLVDNVFISHSSAAQLLVAYGVGVQIHVKITQIGGHQLFGNNALDINGQLAQLLKQSGGGKVTMINCDGDCKNKLQFLDKPNVQVIEQGEAPVGLADLQE